MKESEFIGDPLGVITKEPGNGIIENNFGYIAGDGGSAIIDKSWFNRKGVGEI